MSKEHLLLQLNVRQTAKVAVIGPTVASTLFTNGTDRLNVLEFRVQHLPLLELPSLKVELDLKIRMIIFLFLFPPHQTDFVRCQPALTSIAVEAKSQMR